MPASNVEGIGHRVARIRKLVGLTQSDLAAAANLSLSLVKQVECGHRPASPSFTAATARALGVSVADLYDTPFDRPPDPRADHASMPMLRAALDAWDDPQIDGDPISVDELRARLAHLELKRAQSRYATVARDLPALLHQGYVLTANALAATERGESAWAALDDAYALAQAVAYKFGYLDLAHTCAGRQVESGRRSGDVLRLALGQFRRTHLKLHAGDYSSAARLMERTQAELDDNDTPAALAVRGQIHLRQAMIDARARRADQADAHVAEARAIVDRGVPIAPYLNMNCSKLNVDVHWCAVPLELGDGTAAVDRGSRVDVSTSAKSSRAGHHWIDQARAWTLHGDRERALGALVTARRTAPEQTRYHPQVRETLVALAETDRRATDSLSGFARWAGVGL